MSIVLEESLVKQADQVAQLQAALRAEQASVAMLLAELNVVAVRLAANTGASRATDVLSQPGRELVQRLLTPSTLEQELRAPTGLIAAEAPVPVSVGIGVENGVLVTDPGLSNTTTGQRERDSLSKLPPALDVTSTVDPITRRLIFRTSDGRPLASMPSDSKIAAAVARIGPPLMAPVVVP